MASMYTQLRYKNQNIPEDDDDDEHDDATTNAPGKKKKVKSTANQKKKKQKAMKQVHPVKASQNSPKPQARKHDGLSEGYKAGSFSQERIKYIRSVMLDKKLSWKDAAATWVSSPRRAELLAGMSPSELSRRRFVPPKAKS